MHVRIDIQMFTHTQKYIYTHPERYRDTHTCMHTIRYIILVNCNVLFELTKKLPGKWGYSTTFRPKKECLKVCSPRWRLWMVSLPPLPPPSSVAGKKSASNTKVKPLLVLSNS